MNTDVQTTAVIRQRGQLTIPDTLRDRLSWISANSVVSVYTENDNKIIIEPYINKKIEKNIDWKKLRLQLSRVSSFKGKRGKLSDFIARDRYRH